MTGGWLGVPLLQIIVSKHAASVGSLSTSWRLWMSRFYPWQQADKLYFRLLKANMMPNCTVYSCGGEQFHALVTSDFDLSSTLFPEEKHTMIWEFCLCAEDNWLQVDNLVDLSISAEQTHVNEEVWLWHFLKVQCESEVQKSWYSLHQDPSLGCFWGVM